MATISLILRKAAKLTRLRKLASVGPFSRKGRRGNVRVYSTGHLLSAM